MHFLFLFRRKKNDYFELELAIFEYIIDRFTFGYCKKSHNFCFRIGTAYFDTRTTVNNVLETHI